MPIEIESLQRFGAYCAQEAKNDISGAEDEPKIFEKLACAERWGEAIVRLSELNGNPIEDNILLGLKYGRMPAEAELRHGPEPGTGLEEIYSLEAISGAAEILSKFWTHGEAMRKWISTQVLIEAVRKT